MKKLICFALALVMAFAAMPFTALADTEYRLSEDGLWTYRVKDDNTAELIGEGDIPAYHGENFKGEFTLPSVVDGYTVTSLGRYALYDPLFTSIIVPDTVTEIKFCALGALTNTEELTIPDSVQVIEESAFSNGFYSLSSIHIHKDTWDRLSALALADMEKRGWKLEGNGYDFSAYWDDSETYDYYEFLDFTPYDSYSVTATDQIALNLYLDIEPETRPAESVTLSYKDESLEEVTKTYQVSALTPYEENDYSKIYAFTVPLAPAQIADEIYVYFDDENEALKPVRVSIVDYCKTICNDEKQNAPLRRFCAAVIEYGFYANEYFGKLGTDFSQNDYKGNKSYQRLYHDTSWSNYELYDYYDIWSEEHPIQNTGIAFSGYTYMATSKPSFRFYYNTIDEEMAAEYNKDISVSGLSGVSARFVKDENEKVLLEVTGILPEDFDKTVTVAFGDNSVTFNANDVIFNMCVKGSNESLDLQSLAENLFTYGIAAKEIFG